MISQPLPNIKTQFSQKEKVGIYDNIALNLRHNVNAQVWHTADLFIKRKKIRYFE